MSDDVPSEIQKVAIIASTMEAMRSAWIILPNNDQLMVASIFITEALDHYYDTLDLAERERVDAFLKCVYHAVALNKAWDALLATGGSEASPIDFSAFDEWFRGARS